MNIKTLFVKYVDWLKSPEVFGCISKNIPGKWMLYEYYIDSKEELLNFKDEDLKALEQSLHISFMEDESYSVICKIPVSHLQNLSDGKWERSKNFITLIHPSNFRDNVEFQFAFEKGNLKLLKKDSIGQIEFFGFFCKVPD